MARNCMFSFGLISFAAKLDTAAVSKPDMKNLCVGSNGKPAHDPKPLVAPRQCPDCGEISDYTNIKKGVKQGSGYVMVEAQDVKDAKVKNTEAYKGKISLVPHPSKDFLAQTAPGKAVYYMTPADAASEDHYQLIRELIEKHPELSFASLYTPVSAAGQYMATVRNGVIVLEERIRGRQLKAEPSVGGTVNPEFYKMLEAALQTFVAPYDPDAYEDKYATALDKLISAGTSVSLGAKEKKLAEAEAVLASDEDIMAKLAELAKAS